MKDRIYRRAATIYNENVEKSTNAGNTFLFYKKKIKEEDKFQFLEQYGKKLEKYFSKIKFDENARMLSVVLHDNLDGEYLFVGHVGVMVPYKGGYLFVEKLTFEEPYQAIKFATKEECYKYLQGKYADYTGEGLAKPFVMDNGKLVEVE